MALLSLEEFFFIFGLGWILAEPAVGQTTPPNPRDLKFGLTPLLKFLSRLPPIDIF